MGLKDRVSGFFGKFDPAEASLKAGIEYLVAGGYFGTQLEGIPETDDEIIDQSAKFSKALIPFLGTKDNPWAHELLDRFLQNYELYLYLKNILETRMKAYSSNKLKSLRDALVSEGKIILSLTYGKIENKTIIINKGFLFDPNMNRGGFTPGNTQLPQLEPPLKGFSGRIRE